MAPIRAALVADVLLTPMGGVARSVRGVIDELAALDPDRLEVTVIACRRPEVDGARFELSRTPRIPRMPNQVFALQRPATIRGYDLVHYIDSRPPLTYALGRTPTVITQHGFAALMFPEDYPWNVRAVNRALCRIARYADLTLTASESERREVLSRVPVDPERVVAIHHGVEHDRFFPPDDREAAAADVRERFGIQGPYVLYVSNHQKKKNTDRLVEAFARVAADDPDVTLVLTGWHTPAFRLVEEAIARAGIGDRVHVLGHVPDEALPALYQAASVFALPSLHEGFGIPVLEAMACNTPVVAANVYALAEVCDGAAELVDPYSVEDIARGLDRVLHDDARAAELRERGLARAAGFTWRLAAERHLEAYERLLGRTA